MGANLLRESEWSATPPDGAGLFWNPGAISYLAELLLAAILAAYFGARVIRDLRHGRFYLPTCLLALAMCGLVLGFWASLVRVLTAGGWVSYAMPWSPLHSWVTLSMPWARPFGGMAAAAFVLFAYHFPQPLRGARREAWIVGTMLGLLVLVEIGIAIRTDMAIMRREAWWRPEWITGWMNIAMIWAATLFWRQFASAQIGPQTVGRIARCFNGIASIVQAPANREATAARGFILFTLLPILHTTALFLPNEGQFGRYPLDIFICWLVLVQLVGFALVLLGYLPERSSFQFKLTVISLAVMLGSVNGVAWMMSPAYADAFRAPGMVSTGKAITFAPRDDGSYVIFQPVSFAPRAPRGKPVGAEGARIPLPFPLTFYGKRYSVAYVNDRGAIGFERMPQPSDAAFGTGTQPAIYPLQVDVPDAGTDLSISVSGDRLVVSRVDRCNQELADDCYHLQTIIHADGFIDIFYLRIPSVPAFWLFSPTQGPWLTGITPGSTQAQTPLIRDYYRAFLTYIDRLYAPLVLFLIAMTLAVLLVIPLLLRGFIVRPLERLLDGIRRFRNGSMDTQVAVIFHDEIGYLTDSFNQMAREQHDMLRDLEKRVAARVADIEAMTVHNTQLEERNRLSADLHDAVAQTLTSASLLANAMPAQLRSDDQGGIAAAERIARLNRHALIEMQTLLGELRGGTGSDRPLTDRLRDLVGYFTDLHPLTIDCELVGETPLPAEVKAVFYRIAQESLNNIVKHSGASHADLFFDNVADHALLVVTDHGKGCDPAMMDKGNRLGMTIMRDRARQIGATLEIEGRPGHGCRVTMIWSRLHDDS